MRPSGEEQSDPAEGVWGRGAKKVTWPRLVAWHAGARLFFNVNLLTG